MKADAKKKISIIVPVYNVQAYIEKCLDSILMQTYTDFEVICIDDGSTDNSGKICDLFQKKDNRIRVCHIENQGVSHARNYGLSLMEGSWFCFVDSDDWIEPNYLERMWSLANERQCELVACGIDKTYERTAGGIEVKEQIFTFDSREACIQNYICGGHSMNGYSWNKLYSAEKFRDVRFDENLRVNEDCMYIYEIMSRCERACLTTLKLYHWYIRKDSACHKRAKKADFSAADVFLKLYDKIQGNNMYEAQMVLCKNYILSVVQVLLFAEYERGNIEVAFAKKQCKKWKKDVWNRFSMKQKLKYFLAIYFRKGSSSKK